jgi:hypothetical protein
VLLSGLLAAACANPGYDSDEYRSELVEAGLTREEADCVADGLERTFGDQRLNSRNEVTEEEYAEMVEILDRCGVEVSELYGAGQGVTSDATPSS